MPSVERMLICFILFAEVMDDLHKMSHPKTKIPSPMISDYHHAIIVKYADRLNSAIIYDRDFNYNYFGFKVNMCLTSVLL
jgi:ribonucleoside-diphosphate reductase subunit M1